MHPSQVQLLGALRHSIGTHGPCVAAPGPGHARAIVRTKGEEKARCAGGFHAAQMAGSTSPIDPRNSVSASGSIGVGWLLTITMRAPASFATGTTPATG